MLIDEEHDYGDYDEVGGSYHFGRIFRYYEDRGDKGYIFYLPENLPSPPPSSSFEYHTDPNNPDSDGDGSIDSLDPIPLDYDLDGDNKINSKNLVAQGHSCFNQRIYDAVTAYNRLETDENGFVPDYDMDQDGLDNGDDDTDMDADGMPDLYEVKYGELDIIMYEGDNYAENQVNGEGWQNPLIHNARYGLLIGGGGYGEPRDGPTMGNLPAFNNDLKALYDKLREYKFHDEYIYSFLWNKKDSDGYYIDGPAIWEHDSGSDTFREGETLIEDAFINIGNRISKNDLFFFAIYSHGGGGLETEGPNIGDGWSELHFYFVGTKKEGDNIVRDLVNKWNRISISDLKEKYELHINNNICKYSDIQHNPRAIFILNACSQSYGIGNLVGSSDENDERIIMCAENWRQDKFADDYLSPEATEIGGFDHGAFTYRGRRIRWEIKEFLGYYYPWKTDKTFDGFIRSMGSIDNPENVLHMYKNGYIAATNNYLKEILKTEDGTSHPLLEDNNVADWDSSYGGYLYGRTWDDLESDYQTDPSDDGYLSYHTYL